MAKLPQEYSTVLTAGGFERQPVNAENMPAPILSALASKNLALPLPSLTPEPLLQGRRTLHQAARHQDQVVAGLLIFISFVLRRMPALDDEI